jgi:hypothetical protein
MIDRIASAVFDSREDAERALTELWSAGITDSSISVIGRHGEHGDTSEGIDDDDVNKSGAVKGAIGGAVGGTLLGIAASAIPGVGPLAAGGAIAASAVPEAAAIGAGVGALAGGLSGLLTKHGVSEEDAGYYEERTNQGGYFVSVDGNEAGGSIETAQDILVRNGGRNASSQRSTASTF